ncbi:CBS domain-containing protein CBSX3, mitochondrial-like [Humulus lupulus]|uniref:CBS domain-containing protein CBSX3, mitochondrial-like n=1 Tax=Humulus lupulus TaxID=3486 RepID=UPI002B400F62|nr:CBS domain-containing protein CBSX3, mitochondrial-like [Humulus lupulus]XP_062097486.1 CBS domain-containing protein CBSX3, mitochondrial-like [Humulus lupulus]
MQRIVQAVNSCQKMVKAAILIEHSHGRDRTKIEKIFSRFGWITPSLSVQEKGLENVTVAEVLMAKGGENTGSWLWCLSDDIVNDAVKNMARNNIGSLVVLKPGHAQHVAGIITERDYLRKIILEGRSPMHTRVGEIMTDESKLITVKSSTNILEAMQIMTDKQIRHVPVIDGRLVGMISIKDVVRAVVQQQSGELKRLNEFIRGDYY